MKKSPAYTTMLVSTAPTAAADADFEEEFAAFAMSSGFFRLREGDGGGDAFFRVQTFRDQETFPCVALLLHYTILVVNCDCLKIVTSEVHCIEKSRCYVTPDGSWRRSWFRTRGPWTRRGG